MQGMTELGKVASNACLVHTWNYLWMHHVWSLCGIVGQVNQLFCIDQGGGGGCTSCNCMRKHNHSYTTYSFPISLGYKVYRMSFGWLVEGKNIGIDRYPIWAGSISSLWEARGGRYGSSGLSNRSNIRWVGK